MPISKQKLKELAQSLHGGVLSNGLTDDAAVLINSFVEKLHAKLFPKGASVELREVEARVLALNARLRPQPCQAPYAIPLVTIKKIVRVYAGDVKVPDETLIYLCGLIQDVVKGVMLNASHEIQDGVAILNAKHLKASLLNGNRDIAGLLAGVRAKRSSSKKRRSSSKKKRSASKKKRSSSKKCASGKSAVKGFSRGGQRVKAYCRKKSSSR